MQLRRFRLQFRRILRKRKRQATDIGSVAEDSLDRYIVNRLTHLLRVRRFLLGWVGLIVLISIASILQTRALSTHYLQLTPTEGGILREGIIGVFTNANPLYSQTEVDVSASKLLFSGLFKYDSSGNLVPDLAEKYEVDPTETQYKVTLKRNLRWHDDKPITAKDIAFTYNLIQNPEAKSYLLSSWRGVTVTATDKYIITFKLTNALSDFPHSLTTGIIPEHILGTTSPAQLRSSKFNNEQPVGSGPFKFQTVELDIKDDKTNTRIVFEPSSNYYAGSPKLERFVIRTYQDESSLINAFLAKEVDTMVGLKTAPDDIDLEQTSVHRVPISSEVMVFFKNNHEILKDPLVRKALVLSIDKQQALNLLGYPVLPVNGPLINEQTGYNKAYAQVTNKKDEASAILDNAGWKKDVNTGIRSKDGVVLKFKLSSATNPQFTTISTNLQKQWRELGAEVEVSLLSDEDLQASVATHNYDSLMYGISVGADPDVYAYWHGSQGDIRSETRLNLSEYKSAVADKALEAGRTRTDVTNRTIKYKAFLEAWQNDNPALALYQQQFLFITSDDLAGFKNEFMHAWSDRYIDVNQWTIRKTSQKIAPVQ